MSEETLIAISGIEQGKSLRIYTCRCEEERLWRNDDCDTCAALRSLQCR